MSSMGGVSYKVNISLTPSDVLFKYFAYNNTNVTNLTNLWVTGSC